MASILHIEGSAPVRKRVKKLLEDTGHSVVGARTGVDGIRLASQHRPDLVLASVALADLDGYEVTLRLRGLADFDAVPVVVLGSSGDRETALAVGADGFLPMPIDAATFPRKIASYLDGYRERLGDTGEVRLREQSQRIVERLESKIVEISEANRRLEEMARLRREFLQNVSHELATPLTPVMGYLRLMAAGELGPVTSLQRKCLDSIQVSAQRLRSVVDTLLDVSSLESGRMHFYEREYDFADVARRAVEESRPLIEDRSVRLTVEIPNDGLDARGDPDKLRRAMVHVLDNAVKFTPRGSEIAVAARSTAEAGEVFYEFVVADDGPGIEGSKLVRILEPFYQADGSTTRQHGGVGLGLAFVRLVAEAMGGGVELSSPPPGRVAHRLLRGTLVTMRVARDVSRS